ncbi:MAG TPA: hypothetical protein VGM90_14915 [Kofleriaceae bacterium]|jgi:hypothetical protein
MSKDNSTPGASDPDVIASQRSPYNHRVPPPEEYTPPPSPEPIMGRGLIAPMAERRTFYASYSAAVHGYEPGDINPHTLPNGAPKTR